ncbi:hypothetical protein MVEN_02394000 [Mycena venus]|uniref:Uncharacterized protein n=1 Tax=Mycena venus TaxID=2733690 RepID=A0A8H6X2A4_9AGAR|nr:hypothetical protein MVEN_02394000 [Mycena venus]
MIVPGFSLPTSATMAPNPLFFRSSAASPPLRDSSSPHSTMFHSESRPGPVPECTPSPAHTVTMTSTFPPLDSSPSSHLGLSVRHGAWDIRPMHSNFKYRVAFTWHVIKSSCWYIVTLGAIGSKVTVGTQRSEEEFWKSVSRADPDEDIWFWEDEDEEYVKAFIDDHPEIGFEMSEAEWDTACQALEVRDRQHQRSDPLSRFEMSEAERGTVCLAVEAHDRQHQRSSPLSHLTPQARLRFMAWLVVAAVYAKLYRFHHASLHMSIQSMTCNRFHGITDAAVFTIDSLHIPESFEQGKCA